MHHELLLALANGPGLVLVTGPTGHGKTTVIEAVLADPVCPPNVVFLGDIRGDVELAQRALQLARFSAVVAVLRSGHGAGAFRRLVDIGVSPIDVAAVVRAVFTTRLFRLRSEALLVHERLDVSASIRTLVLADAEPDAIQRQAMADGMQTLRHAGLEHVRAGRLTHDEVIRNTPEDRQSYPPPT